MYVCSREDQDRINVLSEPDQTYPKRVLTRTQLPRHGDKGQKQASYAFKEASSRSEESQVAVAPSSSCKCTCGVRTIPHRPHLIRSVPAKLKSGNEGNQVPMKRADDSVVPHLVLRVVCS